MKYRKLNDILTVSEIGYGCWGIGGEAYGKTDDKVSKDAIQTAVEQGVTFFDTSPFYGRSEKLLGETLPRQKVVIATKFGLLDVNKFDLSIEQLDKSLTQSLIDLQTDYVDLLQIHSPPVELVTDELIAALEKYKAAGKIRSIGYSVKNPSDADYIMDKFGITTFQINFNIADQRLLDTKTYEHAGIIARTPFAFGFLTNNCDYKNEEKDHRKNFQQEAAVWTKYYQKVMQILDSPENLALRFCLSFKIATVIPGMLNSTQVKQNIAASDQGVFSSEQIALIKHAYQEMNL